MSEIDKLIKLSKMAESKGDIDTAKKALLRVKELKAEEKNKPVEYDPLETVKNISGSAYQYGSDVISGIKEAVTSPIETAKGLYNFGNSAMNRGEQALVDITPPQIVNYLNRSNNALADLGIPLKKLPENKEDMTFDNLGPANAMMDYMGSRLGSVDAIKRTAMNDPVGLLGDASLIATGTGGILGGARGAKLGAALEPINLTKNTVKKAGGLISEKVPNDMYKSAVKFSTRLDENGKTDMAKTALDEGIMPTAKGIDKAKEITRGLDDIVNSLIDQSVAKGDLIPVKALFTKLKPLRQKVGGAKFEAKADLKKIDESIKEFKQYMDERGQTHMTVREMQDFKINLTKKIYGDKIALRTIPEKDAVRAAMAEAARESISNKIPEVAALNKRESGLLQLAKGLDRPAGRIDNLNYIGIDPALKGGTGFMLAKGASVSPEIGAAAGVGAGILGKPKNKVRIAMLLDRIRKAGNQEGLLTSDPLVRSILQQSAFQEGRANREGLLY